MKIENTKDKSIARLSYLIFGKSKTGKTLLTTTTPPEKTLLINVENNLSSIYGANVNKADAFEWPAFMEVLTWLEGIKPEDLPEWVFIDSITELAKVLLQLELSLTKDSRQAYGEMGQKIPDVIRRLKALPINLVCLGQQNFVKDDVEGTMYFSASMPGKQIAQSLPYMFDAVIATRAIEAEKVLYYTLQCKPTNQYDNIGVRTSFNSDQSLIAEHETPDLMALHNKIISQGAE